LDFGVAKIRDATTELTAPGQVLGTAAYMPPEQLGGESDARADVWSLGVTGYEMLDGAPPFRATNALAILHAVRTRDPPPPPGPPALQAILMKCLEKDPARRYAHGAEVAGDLERFLGGERVAARPRGRVARGYRFVVGRNRVAAIALVVAALV